MKYTYQGNGEGLSLDASACARCGTCAEVCPHGVFALDGDDGLPRIEDKGLCMECGACALNCPTGAITAAKGVGCAAAVINAKLGRKGGCSCDPDDSCC